VKDNMMDKQLLSHHILILNRYQGKCYADKDFQRFWAVAQKPTPEDSKPT